MFEDITAEGADLKEGTDSGTLRRNVFRRAGTSGQNSADSAVDAKGNNWVIEDNVVTETDAAVGRRRRAAPSEFVDGFQSHSVYDGYGTGNVFRAQPSTARSPASASACTRRWATSSRATTARAGAAKGLVGDNGRSASCGPRPR